MKHRALSSKDDTSDLFNFHCDLFRHNVSFRLCKTEQTTTLWNPKDFQRTGKRTDIFLLLSVHSYLSHHQLCFRPLGALLKHIF